MILQVGDYTIPSYMGMKTHHYTDSYEPTSRIECHNKGFERCSSCSNYRVLTLSIELCKKDYSTTKILCSERYFYDSLINID